MSFSPGTRLGPYEILSLLGAGGMGEVYRARDTKLGRDVAIKVLPDAVAADPERLARFQREAQVLAALNHPHIAHIHGLDESTGAPALVMELVEGSTLADRLADGPLPLDEALSAARQIAEAVEAAHDQGIIHRDLKPANIKVRDDGTVKVLDFGLAKALEPAGASGPHATESPTITTPAMMTSMGTILGTAAYMSPEQAKGRPADKRSDIWAFGCVLYEMLTGRRAFRGGETLDVLASILTKEPDFGALPAATPSSIRRLLRRCLEKNRDDRLRDFGDVRIEIRHALTKSDSDEVPAAAFPGSRSDRRVGLVAALALIALIAVVAIAWTLRPASPSREMHLEISTPATRVPASLAISPDGRAIAFVASADGQPRLWLRMLDSTRPRILAGTDGAENPFWSPDSRSIGFFADEGLKRIDIENGSIQTLARVYRGTGGAWNRDGVILFSSLGNPISRLSERGGEPVALSGLFQQGSDFAPRFLPDGRHFLYRVRGTSEADGIYIGQLDGKLGTHRVIDSAREAVYLSSGYLLFIRQRSLLAQRFDPDRLLLTGNSFPATEDATDCECAGLSVSDAGLVAYRAAPGRPRTFVWFDRAGKEIARVPGDTMGMSSPSLSPDGRRVVGYRGNPVDGNLDVWMLEDVTRGGFNRLTDNVADDTNPVWSPDGDHIVFSSNRTGSHDLYRKSVAGGGEEPLLTTPQHKLPLDWSSNGRFILFESRDPKTGTDLWALPVEKGGRPGTPFPVAQGDFEEQRGQFSPDSNWIAYQSNKSGHHEIYLRAFPGPGFERLVSTNGGSQVRWRRDGTELFYVALDGRLMAVPVRLPPNAAEPEVGAPVALFAPPLGGAVQQGDFRHQYMVSNDGQRFLVATVAEGAADAPITVILNWKPGQQP